MASPLSRSLKIGVDNGGVCSMHAVRHVADASNVANDQKIKSEVQGHVSRGELDMPGVIESLFELKSRGHLLYLESFSSRSKALVTLADHEGRYPNLWQAMHFIKNKSYKADVCEHVGLDIMIDDTFEIIESVAKQNPSMIVIWFQADPSFDDQRVSQYDNVKIATTWKDVIQFCDERSQQLQSSQSQVSIIAQRVGFLDLKQWNKRVYPIDVTPSLPVVAVPSTDAAASSVGCSNSSDK